MRPLAFRLVPFDAADGAAAFSVEGSIARRADLLSVRWELRGDLSALSIPVPAGTPARRERLWEDTCFELFVARRGSPAYRELNLSPAGDWDVYRFASYRAGMRREEAIRSLPFDVRRGPDALLVKLSFDLGRILPAGAPVKAGVSAVVLAASGRPFYFALRHAGPRPDFHRRDGFLMSIRCETDK